MTLFSQASVLLWSTLAVMMQIFLVTHLWKFDRFRCLRWDSGRQPGAFKRVMTYSYLATLPLLVVFSVSLAVIKYREGYIVVPADLGAFPMQRYALPAGSIIPTPYFLWSEATQRWIFPLYLVLAMGWALEMVTHLEELVFWLFLINQGPNPREWFGSTEFKMWAVGSLLAIIAMPVITTVTRADPLKCEAWLFFAGSVGSTLITVWFLLVLAQFPRFLRRVRAEGAEPRVVVRLVAFNELNRTRVLFRFLFTIPFLIMALDGIRPSERHPIIESALATDLLTMLGAIGCVFSSGITLLIFFPRSMAEEAGYRTRAPSAPAAQTKSQRDPSASSTATAHENDGYHDEEAGFESVYSPSMRSPGESVRSPPPPPPREYHPYPPVPSPRTDMSAVSPPPTSDGHGTRRGSVRVSRGLHPYIARYASPIDLYDERDEEVHVQMPGVGHRAV